MTEHTPGPWKMDVVGREGNPHDPRHCQIVTLTHGKHVVIVDTLNCSCIFDIEDQQANAHMIAAAPELLTELKELYAVVRGECPSLLNEDSGGNAEQDARILAAIAKAEGEPA